jgi:hypothetical protein
MELGLAAMVNVEAAMARGLVHVLEQLVVVLVTARLMV